MMLKIQLRILSLFVLVVISLSHPIGAQTTNPQNASSALSATTPSGSGGEAASTTTAVANPEEEDVGLQELRQRQILARADELLFTKTGAIMMGLLTSASFVGLLIYLVFKCRPVEKIIEEEVIVRAPHPGEAKKRSVPGDESGGKDTTLDYLPQDMQVPSDPNSLRFKAMKHLYSGLNQDKRPEDMTAAERWRNMRATTRLYRALGKPIPTSGSSTSKKKWRALNKAVGAQYAFRRRRQAAGAGSIGGSQGNAAVDRWENFHSDTQLDNAATRGRGMGLDRWRRTAQAMAGARALQNRRQQAVDAEHSDGSRFSDTNSYAKRGRGRGRLKRLGHAAGAVDYMGRLRDEKEGGDSHESFSSHFWRSMSRLYNEASRRGNEIYSEASKRGNEMYSDASKLGNEVYEEASKRGNEIYSEAGRRKKALMGERREESESERASNDSKKKASNRSQAKASALFVEHEHADSRDEYEKETFF